MVEIVGVYLVPEAPEPCHLVELIVTEAHEFNMGEFTQETPGQPRANWQVPWDERFLTPEGTEEAAQETGRVAFFFHYLNPSVPLLTPFGPVVLPNPQERPTRLDWLRYEEP
jgi:hypothetical protein